MKPITTDNNDKKIYEHDIVVIDTSIHVVSWCDTLCGYLPFCCLDEGLRLDIANHGVIKVGNVFENLELIKNQRKNE